MMSNLSIENGAAATDSAKCALMGATAVQAGATLRKRPADGDTLLSDPNILALFGGISRMTLWRWRQELGFPRAEHRSADVDTPGSLR